MEKSKNTLIGMSFIKSFFNNKIMPMFEKFFEFLKKIKARYILFFGLILIFIGIFKQEFFISGIVVSAGAMVYISAKKRAGVFSKEFLFRHLLEFIFIFIIFAVVFLQKDIAFTYLSNPFVNIFLPSLVLSFYIYPTIDLFLLEENKKRIITKILIPLFLMILSYFVGSYLLQKAVVDTTRIDPPLSGVSSNTEETWNVFSPDADFEISLPVEPNKEEKNYKISLDSELSYDQYLYTAQTEKVIYTAEKLSFPPKSNFSDPGATLKALIGVTVKKVDGNLEKAEISVSSSGEPQIDFLITKDDMKVRGRATFKDGKVYRTIAFYEGEDLLDKDYIKFADSLMIK